jgi:endonuclease/exonuclease/phosphatase family metal-dependent hydrolase
MSRLRIATYNLENFGAVAEDEVALGERIRGLRPELLRLDADILCLQEVNAQREPRHKRSLRALDTLLSETPYAAFHRAITTSVSGEKPRDIQNLVVLSRFPIVAHCQYLNDLVPCPAYRPVSAVPRPDSLEPVSWERPMLHATVALPEGADLHVINLHLRAPLSSFIPGQKAEPFVWNTVEGWAEGMFIGEMKRSGQALEVRTLIGRLFDSDPHALIVVLGDFNADSVETPLKILRGDVADTGNAVLASRVLVPLEASVPAGRRYSVRHSGHRLMLDHILVSRSLHARFRTVEIHNEALADEALASAGEGAVVTSFHAPVVAEFQ